MVSEAGVQLVSAQMTNHQVNISGVGVDRGVEVCILRDHRQPFSLTENECRLIVSRLFVCFQSYSKHVSKQN